MTDEQVNFKFNEDKILLELLEKIKETYSKHYASREKQTIDEIFDDGDGLGFCRGNAKKYLSRYGKKKGYNRDDLIKALHYIVFLIYLHDENERKLT